MSEKLPKRSPEQSSVSPEAAEISRKNIERIKELAAMERDPSGNLEALKANVEQQALGREQLKPTEPELKPQPVYNQKQLKTEAFDKTMQRVQSQLSPVERQFSKVIHNKTIEKLSTAGSKTIARPSGILGGGLLALLGSSFVLYYAQHLGFTYNYSLLVLLYAVGFAIGIAAELIMSRFRRSR